MLELRVYDICLKEIELFPNFLIYYLSCSAVSYSFASIPVFSTMSLSFCETGMQWYKKAVITLLSVVFSLGQRNEREGVLVEIVDEKIYTLLILVLNLKLKLRFLWK